jgi:multicomponent Na+:H+ antiporter subunit A
VFLLFAGHNAPGGGFAGGLVAGLALVLRYLAGGRYELGEAAPIEPRLLLGLGLLIAGGTGVIGLALGAQVLQTAFFEATVPVLGHVTLVTALFFDIGVYLVVVGLVLDVLRSLGAELDRRQEEGEDRDPAVEGAIPR